MLSGVLTRVLLPAGVPFCSSALALEEALCALPLGAAWEACAALRRLRWHRCHVEKIDAALPAFARGDGKPINKSGGAMLPSRRYHFYFDVSRFAIASLHACAAASGGHCSRDIKRLDSLLHYTAMVLLCRYVIFCAIRRAHGAFFALSRMRPVRCGQASRASLFTSRWAVSRWWHRPSACRWWA